MKSLKRIKVALAVLLVLVSLGFGRLYSQPNGRGMEGSNQYRSSVRVAPVPDLTDEQKESIEKLMLKHQKEILLFKTEVKEKNSKLLALQVQDKPDMKAINDLIDEIGKINIQITKETVANRQAVRSLLNEEQKVYFDNHLLRSKNGPQGKMRGKGYGNGRDVRSGRDGRGERFGRGR